MDRREAFQKIVLGFGFAMSAPLAVQLLQSCEQAKGDYSHLQFLNEHEAVLLEEIMEVILPETESSPGAKSMGIIGPTDVLLFNLLTDEEQGDFRKSLIAFEAETNFIGLDPTGKESAIKSHLLQDKQLFSTIKKMAIISYFTREKVAKGYMNFNPLPGNFNPCIEVNESTKAWYT
ncbi:gluconate 2-dehydrogenase subunit 3 family protein [Aegicerativicinus sediminis]